MTEQSLAPAFWDNPKEAEAFMKRLSGVKFWVSSIEKLAGEIDDLEALMEMAAEESTAAESGDAPVSEYDKEMEAASKRIAALLDELETKSMLGSEGDNLGALLKINSGAGGTESNDWSSMLLRMDARWVERN